MHYFRAVNKLIDEGFEIEHHYLRNTDSKSEILSSASRHNCRTTDIWLVGLNCIRGNGVGKTSNLLS